MDNSSAATHSLEIFKQQFVLKNSAKGNDGINLVDLWSAKISSGESESLKSRAFEPIKSPENFSGFGALVIGFRRAIQAGSPVQSG